MNGTTQWMARLMTAMTLALVIGALLASGADAARVKTNTSVNHRVQSQRDLCELIGRGVMTVEKTAFGATITRCYGGSEDGTTCVNTKQSTECTKPDMRAPESGPAADIAAGGALDANPDDGASSTPGHLAGSSGVQIGSVLANPDE